MYSFFLTFKLSPIFLILFTFSSPHYPLSKYHSSSFPLSSLLLYSFCFLLSSVRVKAWTLILGLKPHLLMRMHPRMSKWLGRSQNRWSRQERVEGRGPRGSSSSDLTNISQAGIRVTWVIFQEIPTMKIDFRRVRRW